MNLPTESCARPSLGLATSVSDATIRCWGLEAYRDGACLGNRCANLSRNEAAGGQRLPPGRSSRTLTLAMLERCRGPHRWSGAARDRGVDGTVWQPAAV